MRVFRQRLNGKQLIVLIPYILLAYLGNKLFWLCRVCAGATPLAKVMTAVQHMGWAFLSPFPSLHWQDLCAGAVTALAVWLVKLLKEQERKHFRAGIEYGSARWGTAKDIAPYVDPDPEQNIILTQTERLTMKPFGREPKYSRNKNVLVIGGSGSGKTRFFIKPNLMQMHSSYVVTDPKGTLLVECGRMLQQGGYIIKTLNTINFRKSMKYNPFAYIRSEKDILKLVNALITNTRGEGEKSGEDFWVSATRSLAVRSQRTNNIIPLFG